MIERFRAGKVPILLATNVAARGLDMLHIDARDQLRPAGDRASCSRTASAAPAAWAAPARRSRSITAATCRRCRRSSAASAASSRASAQHLKQTATAPAAAIECRYLCTSRPPPSDLHHAEAASSLPSPRRPAARYTCPVHKQAALARKARENGEAQPATASHARQSRSLAAAASVAAAKLHNTKRDNASATADAFWHLGDRFLARGRVGGFGFGWLRFDQFDVAEGGFLLGPEVAALDHLEDREEEDHDLGAGLAVGEERPEAELPVSCSAWLTSAILSVTVTGSMWMTGLSSSSSAASRRAPS